MDVRGFLQEFKNRTGYDFCDYSEKSISRRLQELLNETGLTYEEIIEKAVREELFLARIVEDITVNTTELFRDPMVWVSLYNSLYQNLPQTKFTVWHVGCSVGLEVYSNLILLNELGLIDNCRVIGTDINQRVLSMARAGQYSYKFNSYFKNNFETVMKELKLESKFEDYFEVNEENDTMKVKEKLRQVPRFIRHNLVDAKSPFVYKVDMVFFRNVMIYFNNKLQHKILSMVYDKMYANATLILGRRETLPLSMKGRFKPIGAFYQKISL